MLRRLQRLMAKTAIVNAVEGWHRALYTVHSTRVGAVCYLVKSGLDPVIISRLANWSSDQIGRYGTRLALDPDVVVAWAFYNPVGLRGSYKGSVPMPPPGETAEEVASY